MRLATQCIHGGLRDRESTGGVNTPLEPSSAFGYLDSEEPTYPRYFNTPNQAVVVSRLCDLEKAAAGLLFSSGMAAISSTLLTLLAPGDHAVLQRDLYGGTHHFVTVQLERLGIGVTLVPGTVDALAAALKPRTRLVYIETPSNPLLRITDIAAVGELGRARGLTTVIDNTFASPVNQNPLALGIDLVVHSATKYLGGHSDLCAGALLGDAERIAAIRQTARGLGGSVNPLTCYLLERGLKTLALRVERQNASALQLAERLVATPGIARVHYPGLDDHPDHAMARRQMRGFGGMLSFELADHAPDPTAYQRALRIVTPAVSLGGCESLISSPLLTSHAGVPQDEREALGIGARLLRLSVGIEDVDDLYDDLAGALLERA